MPHVDDVKRWLIRTTEWSKLHSFHLVWRLAVGVAPCQPWVDSGSGAIKLHIYPQVGGQGTSRAEPVPRSSGQAIVDKRVL